MFMYCFNSFLCCPQYFQENLFWCIFLVSLYSMQNVLETFHFFLHSYLYFCICFSIRCLIHLHILQFSSVQSLSHVRLFATPWIAACEASLSITNSWSSPKLMSIESVMPSSHLILCHPLLFLPPIPPSIIVFSNGSTFRMRWPKYWSFSFSLRPSKEHL